MSAVPPYISHRTFRTFMEFLKENGLPARIDKSVLQERFSGSNASHLLNALNALNLTDSEGHPTVSLQTMITADRETEQQEFEQVLRTLYDRVFELNLEKATTAQLREVFRSYGLKETVTTKCESFFIHAAHDAGIKLSPFISRRRHTRQGKAGRPRSSSPATTVIRVTDSEPTVTENTHLALAKLVLNKYPEFDPLWDADVQRAWLDGMKSVYESLIPAKRNSK